MAKSKSNPISRLTPHSVRKNVAKQFTVWEKEETKLLNKITSYEKS